MQAVYVDQCVDVGTVRRWVRRFKDGELGQADLSDKTRSGGTVTASDQLHQNRVEELIRGNRRMKQNEIAVALGISKERVGLIIGVLGFWKVCARRVLRMLSEESWKSSHFSGTHRIAQMRLQVIFTYSQN